MSLPPVTIHIKRKATDEPVDFLRVHESNGKRQRRATDFVFTLQQAPNTSSTPSTPARAPQGLRPIKDIRKAASSQTLGNSYAQVLPNNGSVAPGNGVIHAPISTASKDNTLEVDNAVHEALQNASRQRRFHISRGITPSIPHSPISNDKVRKRGQPTVFIERRPQTSTPRERHFLQQHNLPVSEEAHALPQQPRPQKKPGLVSREITTKGLPKSSHTTQPIPKSFVPPAILNPYDVDSSQLIAELQAFTLAEIGRSLAESEATSITHVESPTSNKSPNKPNQPKVTRFKPKAPALRYSERHPDSTPLNPISDLTLNSSSSMEIDLPSIHQDQDDHMLTDADGDYIIDTYIRVPADILDARSAAHGEKNIGLLILDSQPDIEEFYGEEEGSESEEGDEADEDENAEDYYTADYPDEEVASDDEYGYNAYQYRSRNADDLEDVTDSDNDEIEHEDEYLG